MSVIIQTRGEVGGGVAAHLQCPHCGLFSKSHAHQLSHIAASHPTCLDSVVMGRLGNILMYQSGARLFHCSSCFYTSRDFTKLYKHIITKHCMDERECGGGGVEGGEEGSEKGKEEEEEEDEEGKDEAKRKSMKAEEEKEGSKDVLKKSREEGEKEEEGKDKLTRKSSGEAEEEEEGKEVLKRKSSGEAEEEEEEGKDNLKRKSSNEAEDEEGKEVLKRKRSSEAEDEEGKDKLKRKSSNEAEEEEGKDNLKRKSSNEAEEEGKDVLKRKSSNEAEDEEGKDNLKRKSSGEAEEEEGEAVESVKSDYSADKSVLVFDGTSYRCLICGWKNKLKAVGVSHVVRKHDVPKAYATQAVKREVPMASQSQSSGVEEDEAAVAGLSGELLKEEMKATAKVVRFVCNRFVCLICGWKTKLKGFAISHVVRCHDVERPYSCKDCKRSFFLPSRLQQHVSTAHRPGRYACPFCCFRSHFLGGFRRHCSRCNAREEEEEEGEGGGGEDEENEEEEEGEERKETRGERKRRRTGAAIEEDDEQDEEDED